MFNYFEGAYYNFQQLAMWSEILASVIGFVVFLSILRLIYLLRFNRRMSMLSATLRNSAKDMVTFSVVFFTVLSAFSQFSYIIFGSKLQGYATFITTVESLIAMLLGSFDYDELAEAEPVLGPILFFTFVIVMMFALLNMFLSIINDTFAQVKEDASKQSNDYEMVDFMMTRFETLTGLNISKAIEKVKTKFNGKC